MVELLVKNWNQLIPFFKRLEYVTKDSQNIEDLKHEYIYGSIYKDGRRSFKSLDNLIKEFELSPSTIYRRSSKEQW